MKVAVISRDRTSSVGKKSFILTLATVFAKTQRKRVTLMGTESMEDMLSMTEIRSFKSGAASMTVYQALLESASLQDDEIEEYGIRVGAEEVFAFDIFSSTMDRPGLEKLFLTTLKKLHTELTIVNIEGDPDSYFNKCVMDECDLILYAFNASKPALKKVKSYLESLSYEQDLKTGCICLKYDERVISEKKMSSAIQKNARNLMVFPYNPVIAKLGIDGQLNRIGELLISGNPEVIKLRSRILEVMCYMFDSSNRKYIKGVEQWPT